MGLFDVDFQEQLETDYWIDEWEREGKAAEIRSELNSGVYTKKELYERYRNLLETDYELGSAFSGELDPSAVHEEIQQDIDSGLYTAEEIMDKYDLTEVDLELDYDTSELKR